MVLWIDCDSRPRVGGPGVGRTGQRVPRPTQSTSASVESAHFRTGSVQSHVIGNGRAGNDQIVDNRRRRGFFNLARVSWSTSKPDLEIDATVVSELLARLARQCVQSEQ